MTQSTEIFGARVLRFVQWPAWSVICAGLIYIVFNYVTTERPSKEALALREDLQSVLSTTESTLSVDDCRTSGRGRVMYTCNAPCAALGGLEQALLKQRWQLVGRESERNMVGKGTEITRFVRARTSLAVYFRGVDSTCQVQATWK